MASKLKFEGKNLKQKALTHAEATDQGSEDSAPLLGKKPEKVSKIMRVLQDIDTDVKEYIEDLKTLAHNINVLAGELKRAFTSEEEARLVQEMSAMVDQSKGYCGKVKNCLTDLEDLQGKRKDALTKHERDYCTRILGESSQKFQHAVKELLKSQNNFELQAKHRMKIAVGTLYPDASPEDVQAMVESDPQALKTVIQKKFMEGSSDQALTEHLALLQEEQDALQNLEISVMELNDLFFYMGQLVDKQTEQLQSIEESVDATEEYTGKAVVKLEAAAASQESYENKRNWLKGIICTVIIVAIVAGILLLFFCVIKPLCIDTAKKNS